MKVNSDGMMSTKGKHGFMRPRIVAAAVLVAVFLPGQALAVDNASLWRSLLFPGVGQAHQGHYKKAAIFGGTALLAATGVFLSSVNYTEQANKANAARNEFLFFPTQLMNGEVISITEIDETYARMVSATEEADDRFKVRNFFIGALITVYAINVVDILISKPHDTETAQRIQIEVNRDRVMLTRTFGF
ncbi:MAG: DUF5683 domain-containing protein [bacterium]|nr:DUF5683 domain-containing protein [bacterium]